MSLSHQSPVPHPLKKIFSCPSDPVTCDRVRRKNLLYNRYRIGILYPFFEKADGLLRAPFFPMEDLAMKRTIQSLSLSLLTALLFFRQRERCAGTAAARSDGSGGAEGDGSGVAHERDEPSGGFVLPEEPLPHAGCRAFFGGEGRRGRAGL